MSDLPQEDCGGNNDESNTDKWGFDGVTNNNDDVIADYGYDTEYDDEGDKRVSLDKEPRHGETVRPLNLHWYAG